MLIEPVHKENLPRRETSYIFIFTVLFAYIGVVITTIFFHPLWRDEIYTWSVASASSSLPDLALRKVYDGHPDLWYVLVFMVRQWSDNPVSMQLLHAAIAILTVFLVLKYAPFARIQKVLLVFGYFYLFEYAIISRNYAPGLLMITILLTLNRDRGKHILWKALVLFLLCQTNVFGVIFTIAYVLTRVFEFAFSRDYRLNLMKQKAILAFGILLVLAGIVYSIHTIIPPPSGYYSGITHFSLSQLTLPELIRSIGTVWRAWVPLPLFQLHFWNTNIIGPDVVLAILSLALMVTAGMLFLKRPVVFVFYLTGLTGIIAFILMYYYGYLRHHGQLYILLTTSLWMGANYKEKNIRFKPVLIEKYNRWISRNAGNLFLVILIVQLHAGLFAVGVQFFVPFSAARETAHYIRKNNLDRFCMAGDQDVALQSVSGYLNSEVFYFSRNGFGTYLVYDKARSAPDETRILKMADSLSQAQGDTLLLIMNYKIGDTATFHLKPIRAFENSIVTDEIYYLYLMNRRNDTIPWIR